MQILRQLQICDALDRIWVDLVLEVHRQLVVLSARELVVEVVLLAEMSLLERGLGLPERRHCDPAAAKQSSRA